MKFQAVTNSENTVFAAKRPLVRMKGRCYDVLFVCCCVSVCFVMCGHRIRYMFQLVFFLCGGGTSNEDGELAEVLNF